MSRQVAINARFRVRQSPAGVDFYASELVEAIGGVELVPGRMWRRPVLSDIWEQLILPLRSIGRPLVSPCNTGPLFKRRQLLVIHDTAPMVGPEWFSRAYRWKATFMTRLVGRRVLVLASVSGAAADDVGREAKRDDVIVIANVPTRRAPTTAPAEHRRSVLGGRYLLSIATSDPRKNLATLLAGWQRANTSDAELLLVGGEANHVFSHGTTGPDPERVRRVGRVDDSDLARLLDGCVAVVTIPHYEGYGRVVVEAQLHGRPVIASDIAAHREVAAPGVVFVNSGDVEAVSIAIEAALESSGASLTPVQPAELPHTSASRRAAVAEAISRLHS